MADKLTKLAKVNDSFTVNRYDNGFMVEVNGRDEESDWKTVKVLCTSQDDLIDLINEYNSMELDN
jgi:hypothetical protein